MVLKEEWAKSIISQALMDIRKKEDIPAVIDKVKGTAIWVRGDLKKAFLDLVEAKKKILVKL